MTSIATSKRALGLAVSTALAGALLSGCATSAAPASVSANRAEEALADGKFEQAIAHGEAAVLADPRNPAYRATLASAYLDAGRFASAATSFDDAMQLGDNSPRTALSLALALMGQGRQPEAAALLNRWEGRIATADIGLAYALAGQPEQGVYVLSNGIRNGENTPKMRQNLAYAYALAGHWREARLMAGQDLQGDKLSERIEEWSQLTRPEAWHHRIAALLQVPAGVADAGQPVQLALANTPSTDHLAEEAIALGAAELPQAETPAFAQAPAATRELPALQPIDPDSSVERYPAPEAARTSNFASAFAAPAGAVPQDAMSFLPAPATQSAPLRQAAAPRQAAASGAPQAAGTHLVQLGSFGSEQSARRAWNVYAKKYPELAGHDMVITEANVRGKHYWRVSAAGFGRATASSMCGKVRSAGAGCIAYTQGRPLPGAVDSGVRMARR